MAEFEGPKVTIDEASVAEHFLLEPKRKCIELMECKFMVHTFSFLPIRYKFALKKISWEKLTFSFLFLFFFSNE